MKIFHGILSVAILAISTAATAAPLDFWGNQNWTQIDAEDGVGKNGYVGPGWGGQDFDAEYLYYKLDGNTLSVGIQAGFDLIDGHVKQGGKDYYAGDLALSFDGIASGYEYGVDFGLLTKDYSDNLVDMGTGNGVDAAGLYEASSWNDDIAFTQSSPFALNGGTLVTSLAQNSAGLVGDSYYRVVSFELNEALNGAIDFDAHWTMSCGNDVLDGHDEFTVEVSEPAPYVLFSLGLLLLAAPAVRRRK